MISRYRKRTVAAVAEVKVKYNLEEFKEKNIYDIFLSAELICLLGLNHN